MMKQIESLSNWDRLWFNSFGAYFAPNVCVCLHKKVPSVS